MKGSKLIKNITLKETVRFGKKLLDSKGNLQDASYEFLMEPVKKFESAANEFFEKGDKFIDKHFS